MPTSHVPFFLHRLVPVIVLACSRTIFNIYMQSALYNLGPVGIDMLPQILWDQFLSEVYQPGMHDGHLHNVLFVARPLKQQRRHPATDACSNVASRQRDLSLSTATGSSWLEIRRPA